MNLSLLLFAPASFLETSEPYRARSILLTALLVAAGAAASRTLGDLLLSSGGLFPSTGILLPVILLRFSGILASGLLWSAWLWFGVALLRRSGPDPRPELFAGLVVSSQAPLLFMAGFCLPLSLFAPTTAGLFHGLLTLIFGLWSLVLQAEVLRRSAGLTLPAALGLLIGSFLLLGLLIVLAFGGAAAGIAATVGIP
jgi:hypothetical protein